MRGGDRRALVRAAAIASLLALPALAARPCTLPAHSGAQLVQGPVQLAWLAQPEAIAVGHPFVLQLSLCPTDAKLLRVDATMPEHRHGMNYRPTITAVGPGRWRAEGLLWHMSGRWELAIEVEAAGARHLLRQSVQLP